MSKMETKKSSHQHHACVNKYRGILNVRLLSESLHTLTHPASTTWDFHLPSNGGFRLSTAEWTRCWNHSIDIWLLLDMTALHLGCKFVYVHNDNLLVHPSFLVSARNSQPITAAWGIFSSLSRPFLGYHEESCMKIPVDQTFFYTGTSPSSHVHSQQQ